jgi:hypothetical protein
MTVANTKFDYEPPRNACCSLCGGQTLPDSVGRPLPYGGEATGRGRDRTCGFAATAASG